MADIKFLQDIDFTGVTSKNFVVESENAPATGAVTGQIIFDTTSGANKLAYYNGSSWVQVPSSTSTYSWTAKADNGSDETISSTNSIDFAGGAGISTTISSANGAKTITFAASGSGSMSSFTVSGETGSDQTISDGNTLSLIGANGGGIATVAGATDQVTFAMDVNELGETTTWTNTQDFIAVSDGTATKKISTKNINLGDFDNDMTSGGGSNQKITNVLDPTDAQDAATKNYVDSVVTGNLVFQGGYNAATNTPDLDVNPSSGIKKGWSYVVTGGGNFFTEAVEVGDFLIAQQDSPTTLAHWVTVQNNIGLATATTAGIASFPASTFTIASGVVGLTDRFNVATTTVGSAAQIPTVTVNADGIVTSLTPNNVTIPKPGVSMTTGVSSNGGRTLTYTHNLGAKCIVQVYERGGDPVKPTNVVYPDIQYVSDNAIALNFATSQSTTGFEVCIEPVGV